MILAHVLPCVVELELLALAAWVLEHAALLLASARALLRRRAP